MTQSYQLIFSIDNPNILTGIELKNTFINNSIIEISTDICDTIGNGQAISITGVNSSYDFKINITQGQNTTFTLSSKCFKRLNLTEFTYTNTLLFNISDYTFQETKLIQFTLPKINNIGINVFQDCSQLVDFYFGDNNVNTFPKIPDGFFSICTSLNNIQLPNYLTEISDYAFLGAGITQINIPESLIKIGNNVFDSTLLTSITLPKFTNYCFIGLYIFYKCQQLQSVTINGNIKSQIDPQNNPELIENDCLPSLMFVLCNSLSSVQLYNGLKKISYSFYSCNSLIQITLPSSVDVLQNYTFTECQNLQQITILSPNPTLIGDVFYGCLQLTKIILSKEFIEILNDTFIMPNENTNFYVYTQTQKDSLSKYEGHVIIIEQPTNYINHTFYCTDEEYQTLISNINKTFVNCVFILNQTESQKQIDYITESERFSMCKKIYKQTSTNALTADKLLNPVNINGVAFDGSQDISIPSNIQPSTSGNLMVSNGTSWQSQTKEESGIQRPPNGVNDITKFVCEYSPTNRQFSITTQTDAGFHVQSKYFPLAAGTIITSAHADSTGQYYCYFDVDGVLTVSTQFWDINYAAPLYTVYYTTSNAGKDGVDKKDGILYLETHPGINGMSNSIRKYLHAKLGTQLFSGCLLTQSTGITYSVSQGLLQDEDLETTVSPLPGVNGYRILWQTGSSSSPQWNWKDVQNLGLYADGSSQPQYNYLNDSTQQWQLSAVPDGSFFNQWIVATNAYNAPQIVVVLSQQIYQTVSDAQAATFQTGLKNFNLFAVENVILYKITYRRKNAQNSPSIYYSDIQSIVSVQQSIISASSQLAVKQNVQQLYQNGNKFLTPGISNDQLVDSLTVLQAGKYNVTYHVSFYSITSNSLPEAWSVIYINNVSQLSTEAYTLGKGGCLTNQYVMNLNVGDVVALKIRQTNYGSSSDFHTVQYNLQIIQVL